MIKKLSCLKTKVPNINFIDPKELHDLAKLQPDQLYEKIISWLKNFECSEENQKFRNKVGAVIFNGPAYLVCRLNSCQREEIFLAFKSFNSTPDKRLRKQIEWVKLHDQQIKLSKPNTFAESENDTNQLRVA